MAPPVITVTRQYGSGGSDIARLVAERLGWVLGNRPDALQVYVVAWKAFRMKLAVERLGADPGHVERGVEETDRQRDQYVKTYYGRHRHEVTNYDLVVNAERLGFEGAAGLIVGGAKGRGRGRGGRGVGEGGRGENRVGQAARG